ncbi:hypothetical protein TYRP_013427 [Tyrophagus putrescentiae]|nr:hypothetical protein TYRP_013427 [Tyrophagus putrescentiae]
MSHSVSLLVVAFSAALFSQLLDPSLAFYYNQYHQQNGGAGVVQPVLFPLASDLYPAYGGGSGLSSAQQRSDNEAAEAELNGNAYSNPAALWNSASNRQQVMQGMLQNMYIQNDEPSQADSQAYYAQMAQMQQQQQQQQPPQQQDVCASGFVEHCLVRANADGEQRLMLASMVANQTAATPNGEQATLTTEFDGMCHVVTRFIDCLNAHYLKCSPLNGGRQPALDQQMAHAKDAFAESWAQLCAPDSSVRRNYLQHATCIKHALTENNGQAVCQERFQAYFLSGQFSLDSVENAVHLGCCGFIDWQNCIDSLIVRQCGHDAMKSVQDLIEMASGGLVSSLCDKKTFGRKSKVCMGKKGAGIGSAKLQSLDPKINSTLHKYISIFSDFIDRLPDDEEQ